MNTIKLYVDNLTPDEKVGSTDKPNTIAYNNKVMLSAGLLDEFTDALQDDIAAYIKGIGRYVCITTVSLNDHKYNMMFGDFHNNRETASKVKSNLDDVNTKVLFMQEVNEVSKNYDIQKDSVKLIKGTPPFTNNL